MKPFNLALAIAGKSVVNRDGEKVIRIVHVPEAKDKSYKVMVVNKNGLAYFVGEDGAYFNTGVQHPADLFMAPITHHVWINVWKNHDRGFPFIHSTVHYSLEQAEAERTISNQGYTKELITRLEHIWQEE